MKVWITRDTASSLCFGGLERCWVWFRKPRFVCEVLTENDRDTPFGFIHDTYGCMKRYGWIPDEKFGIHSLSVGNWLGYADDDDEPSRRELVLHIWQKIYEHFHNKPLGDEWVKLEREEKCKIEEFLLEVDITIGLTK